MNTDFFNLSNVQLMFIADLSVLVGCSMLLVLFGRLAHSHPAVIYICFHSYTFTFRLWALSVGAQTLFTDLSIKYGSFLPVTIDEIIRAAILADMAFVLMTIAWIKASVDARRGGEGFLTTAYPMLSRQIVRAVVAVAFIFGVIGLVLFARLPTLSDIRVNLGEWATSSWPLIMISWAGLATVALIYCKGFRWWYSLLMVIYLLIMAYQGFHRLRVVIPVILMAQIYLDRHQLKWPRLRVAIILMAVALLFFPLKSLGNAVQKAFAPDNTQEVSASKIANDTRDGVADALVGKAEDQQFLDEYALYISLMDESDRMYYGKTYLTLLPLPVPRQWWPEKPGLMDWVKDISKPWRPVFEMGMIMTFLGESYANFGVVGVAVLPALFAYFSGRFYFFAYRHKYFSVARFGYLLFACNLIQIFRDGFISIVILTIVDMMPLAALVLLHYLEQLFVNKDSPESFQPQNTQLIENCVAVPSFVPR